MIGIGSTHTPFKKILTETCDLKIEKSKIQNPEAQGLYMSWHNYMIRFNFPRFKERFEEIKKQLLNTNLCRNNKEYFDWINELGCSTSEVCHVIIDGCIANAEVLANIYKSHCNHKLDEWREFCKWIEGLPYSELITGEEINRKD